MGTGFFSRLQLSLSVAIALSLAALAPRRAKADESDYRPENPGWNGLSDLFALARTVGLRPEMRAAIEWGELGPDDGLVIVYPRVEPDLARLREFVLRGGRALLADDFGAARPTFEALGLARGEP